MESMLRKFTEQEKEKKKEMEEEKAACKNQRITNLKRFDSLSKNYKFMFECCESDLRNVLITLCPWNRLFSQEQMEKKRNQMRSLSTFFFVTNYRLNKPKWKTQT